VCVTFYQCTRDRHETPLHIRMHQQHMASTLYFLTPSKTPSDSCKNNSSASCCTKLALIKQFPNCMSTHKCPLHRQDIQDRLQHSLPRGIAMPVKNVHRLAKHETKGSKNDSLTAIMLHKQITLHTHLHHSHIFDSWQATGALQDHAIPTVSLSTNASPSLTSPQQNMLRLLSAAGYDKVSNQCDPFNRFYVFVRYHQCNSG
jgi:hypothetical protein